MANAVSRAYNGGLGRSLQQGPGAELLVRGQGRSPPEAESFSAFQVSTVVLVGASGVHRSEVKIRTLVDDPDDHGG